MSINSTSKPEPSEDIDLLLLAERIILFFKKNKWIFIAAIILGIALGIFGYSKIQKTYKSRLILHSFTLTNSEQIEIIDNWDNLLRKKEYDELSAAFNCPINMLRKVKQMKATEIQKVFTPNNPNGYYVDVVVTDNSVLDPLQKGIVDGLENTEYIKQRLEARRADLKELIGEVEKEISKLDSTKTQMENILEGKEKSTSSLIIDGSSINRQLVDMTEKLLSLKQELRFTSAVQVLQGFSKFKKPSDPNLMPLVALGLIFCLGIAYIITLIRSLNESLKKRLKHSNSPV